MDISRYNIFFVPDIVIIPGLPRNDDNIKQFGDDNIS